MRSMSSQRADTTMPSASGAYIDESRRRVNKRRINKKNTVYVLIAISIIISSCFAFTDRPSLHTILRLM